MSLIRPDQCQKCKFALPRANEPGKFDCRRDTPTVGIFPQRDQNGNILGTQMITSWPIVGAEQWCGEYRPHIQMSN